CELLRVVRPAALVDTLLDAREVLERHLDVRGEVAHETHAEERAEDEAERIAERRAGPRLVAEGHDGVTRRARELGQLAAGREGEDLRAAPSGFLEGRERLLGVARIARRDHERVSTDVAWEPVVAMHRHRHLELALEQRRREVAAERRPAHAGDDDAAHISVRRWDASFRGDRPRIADLLSLLLDPYKHVLWIGRADPLV